jgi:protein-S-isoprenylcysteine O-methyltransferase Ste14
MTLTPKLIGGILMLSFGALEFFMRRGATAKGVRPTSTDRGTSLAIVAAYAIAVVAISSNLLPNVALPSWMPWIGVALGAAGLLLRVWSMRVLGRFYTRTFVTTSDQIVVREGPFRLVRHPGYLGSLVLWLGAAATSGNLLAIVAVAVLLGAAYTFRVRVEEGMLLDALGEPYAEYRRHSWRLVPFVF